jgi:hypothetical protein
MRPPQASVVVALAVLSGACSRNALTNAPDASPVDGRAADAAAAADSATAAPGDATPPDSLAAAPSPDSRPDQAPSPAEAAYLAFVGDRFDDWLARAGGCFGDAPVRLRQDQNTGSDPFGPFDPGLLASLRSGRVVVDANRAAACLSTLRNAPCDTIAAFTQSTDAVLGPACSSFLVGQVPAGGSCVRSVECRDGGVCAGETAGCGSHCVPPSPPHGFGEACPDQSCLRGLVCRTTDAGEGHCGPALVEGTACLLTEDPCEYATWCRPDVPGGERATCSRIAAGTPCMASGQCPGRYMCLLAPGKTSGVCGAGHKAGEPCSIFGLDQTDGPSDDCSLSTYCYPRPDGSHVCGLGHRLGEDCADLDVGGASPYTIPCLEGDCKKQPDGHSVCAPLRHPGEPCDDQNLCDSGLGCERNFCGGPPRRNVGEACDTGGACTEDSYCKPDDDPSGKGRCAPQKPMGAACTGGSDECLPPATCVKGVCTTC